MSFVVKNTKHVYDKCADFALKQITTSANFYSRREPSALKAMINNIIMGKLAEFGVYKMLLKFKYKPSKPDLLIYEKKSKNYNADITTKCGKKVHIKSQTIQSAQRHGQSWIFQLNDPVTFIPDENDYICLTCITKTFTTVKAVIKAKELISHYKTMRVQSYAVTKHALYWEDIKHLAEEQNLIKGYKNTDLY